jgi:hypothetical protein
LLACSAAIAAQTGRCARLGIELIGEVKVLSNDAKDSESATAYANTSKRVICYMAPLIPDLINEASKVIRAPVETLCASKS